MNIKVVRAGVVPHNDPGAAGFTAGFSWSFSDHLGDVESYAPSRDEAVKAATAAATGRGHDGESLRFVWS